MVTFAHLPAWGLVAVVAAVAVVTLYRPGRKVAVVSTLRLWQQALEAAPAGKKRRRRLSRSWLLLLAGALIAMLAATGPVVHRQSPARRVALAIHAGAELCNPPGRQRLRQTAQSLLQRLDEHDRVQLLLPPALGGATGWLTPDEAWRLMEALEPLPQPAEELHLPAPDPTAQRVYRIYPASLHLSAGPGLTDLPLSTTLPPLTLDALAATTLPDGSAQLFAAVRNHRDEPATAELIVRAGAEAAFRHSLMIGPQGRQAEIIPLPSAVLTVEASLGPGLGQSATLTAVEADRRAVALLGRDHPDLRRFVAAMPGAELSGDPRAADVVLSVGQTLPEGRGGVVFDPPVPPPGWRLAEEVFGPLALADADVAGGLHEPLLADVDLAGVVARRVRPFVRAAGSEGRVLASVGGKGTLLLATEQPRRLYVAIDPDPSNTNWPLDESFPILLANALEWVAPGVPVRHWRPGADGHGVLGLRAADAPPIDVTAVPLPPPRPFSAAVPLGPGLALLAAGLWLSGWAWRFREGGRL